MDSDTKQSVDLPRVDEKFSNEILDTSETESSQCVVDDYVDFALENNTNKVREKNLQLMTTQEVVNPVVNLEKLDDPQKIQQHTSNTAHALVKGSGPKYGFPPAPHFCQYYIGLHHEVSLSVDQCWHQSYGME